MYQSTQVFKDLSILVSKYPSIQARHPSIQVTKYPCKPKYPGIQGCKYSSVLVPNYPRIHILKYSGEGEVVFKSPIVGIVGRKQQYHFEFVLKKKKSFSSRPSWE